jgi:hypothetical protein
MLFCLRLKLQGEVGISEKDDEVEILTIYYDQISYSLDILILIIFLPMLDNHNLDR